MAFTRSELTCCKDGELNIPVLWDIMHSNVCSVLADMRWDSSSDLDISVDRLSMEKTKVPMDADMNT